MQTFYVQQQPHLLWNIASLTIIDTNRFSTVKYLQYSYHYFTRYILRTYVDTFTV